MMPAVDIHHSGFLQPVRRIGSRLAAPLLLLLICAGFHWKLVFTTQYTWLESTDLAYQVLPWFQYQAGEWREGRFPLWDPYTWAGQPLHGQAQPGVAYPLNWLLFLLPQRDGWIKQISLHWYLVVIGWMAALTAYALCRDLKRSRGASVIAASLFALGGYFGSIDWPQMLNGAVWAPLVLLFLLRALNRRRPVASAAAAGAFLGIALLSGHHQIPTYTALAAGAVILLFMFRGGRLDLNAVRVAALFGIFAFLVGAAQSFPAYEYGKLAHRWVGLPEPVDWQTKVPYTLHAHYSLQPASLLGIVVPGIHSNTNPHTGAVAVALALLAVALCWQQKTVRISAVLAVLSLFFSLANHTIFHGVLYSLLPLVEKARSPSMAIFIFHLAFVPLIAYGIDHIQDHRSSPWIRRACLWLIGFGTLVFVTYFVLIASGRIQITADTRPLMAALVALLLAGLLHGCAREAFTRRAFLLGVGALMLIELGNVSHFFLPHETEEKRRTYLKEMAQHADIVEFIRSTSEYPRVVVDDDVIRYNIGDWHGIDVYGGYLASITSNLLKMDLHAERVKNLVGVEYIIGNQPSMPDAVQVFESSGGLKVYRNPHAFPRAFAVHRAIQYEKQDEIHPLMFSIENDLRTFTFVPDSPPVMEQCAAPDEVRILRRESNRVVILAEMGCAGMVVLSDTHYPGWVANVNGEPAKMYAAYSALRGVGVGAGTSIIEMHYRPASFYWGAGLTLLGLMAAVVLGWLSRRREFPDGADGNAVVIRDGT